MLIGHDRFGQGAGRWFGSIPRVLKLVALSPFVSQDMGLFLADLNPKDLAYLGELMEAGKVTPVIDRRYPLEDVVEATRYVETEQKTGNVVLTVTPSGS